MTYKIDQTDTYVGSDYWKWSAWIEADSAELDRIKSVIWVLHPTFTPSTIEATDRRTRFRLETSGWGTFRIKAELQFHSGETKSISAMLRLSYPDESDRNPPESAPVKPAEKRTVFVSYSSEDEGLASDVQKSIRNLGMKVVDVRSISHGLPIEAAVRKMIRESDCVMGVVGSDFVSPWVTSELTMAIAQDKPVFAVTPGKLSRAALRELSGVKKVQLSGKSATWQKQLSKLVSGS